MTHDTGRTSSRTMKSSRASHGFLNFYPSSGIKRVYSMHKKKIWVGSVALIIIFVFLILLFVSIIPALIKTAFVASSIQLTAVSISNLSDNYFDLKINAEILSSSSISATISPMYIDVHDPSDVSNSLLGQFSMPAITTTGTSTPIIINTKFKIVRPDLFRLFSSRLLKGETAEWTLRSSANVRAAVVSVSDVLFSKTIVFPAGSASIENIRIQSFSMEGSSAEQLFTKVTAQFLSAGKFAVDNIGDVQFEILYKQIRLGILSSHNSSLSVGINYTELFGEIKPEPLNASTSVEATDFIFKQFINEMYSQKQPLVTIHGLGSSIDLFSGAIQAISMTVPLHMERVNMIKDLQLTEVAVLPPANMDDRSLLQIQAKAKLTIEALLGPDTYLQIHQIAIKGDLSCNGSYVSPMHGIFRPLDGLTIATSTKTAEGNDLFDFVINMNFELGESSQEGMILFIQKFITESELAVTYSNAFATIRATTPQFGMFDIDAMPVSMTTAMKGFGGSDSTKIHSFQVDEVAPNGDWIITLLVQLGNNKIATDITEQIAYKMVYNDTVIGHVVSKEPYIHQPNTISGIRRLQSSNNVGLMSFTGRIYKPQQPEDLKIISTLFSKTASGVPTEVTLRATATDEFNVPFSKDSVNPNFLTSPFVIEALQTVTIPITFRGLNDISAANTTSNVNNYLVVSTDISKLGFNLDTATKTELPLAGSISAVIRSPVNQQDALSLVSLELTLTIYYNSQVLGTVFLPETKLIPKTNPANPHEVLYEYNVNLTNVSLTLNNQVDAAEALARDYFMMAYIDITAEGVANVRAESSFGDLDLSEITMKSVFQAQGLNSVQNMHVQLFELSETAPEGAPPSALGAQITTTLYNPSVNTLSIGDTLITAKYMNQPIGFILKKNLVIAPKENTYLFEGYVSAETDVGKEALGQFLADLISKRSLKENFSIEITIQRGGGSFLTDFSTSINSIDPMAALSTFDRGFIKELLIDNVVLAISANDPHSTINVGSHVYIVAQNPAQGISVNIKTVGVSANIYGETETMRALLGTLNIPSTNVNSSQTFSRRNPLTNSNDSLIAVDTTFSEKNSALYVKNNGEELSEFISQVLSSTPYATIELELTLSISISMLLGSIPVPNISVNHRFEIPTGVFSINSIPQVISIAPLSYPPMTSRKSGIMATSTIHIDPTKFSVPKRFETFIPTMYLRDLEVSLVESTLQSNVIAVLGVKDVSMKGITPSNFLVSGRLGPYIGDENQNNASDFLSRLLRKEDVKVRVLPKASSQISVIPNPSPTPMWVSKILEKTNVTFPLKNVAGISGDEIIKNFKLESMSMDTLSVQGVILLSGTILLKVSSPFGESSTIDIQKMNMSGQLFIRPESQTEYLLVGDLATGWIEAVPSSLDDYNVMFHLKNSRLKLSNNNDALAMLTKDILGLSSENLLWKLDSDVDATIDTDAGLLELTGIPVSKEFEGPEMSPGDFIDGDLIDFSNIKILNWKLYNSDNSNSSNPMIRLDFDIEIQNPTSATFTANNLSFSLFYKDVNILTLVAPTLSVVSYNKTTVSLTGYLTNAGGIEHETYLKAVGGLMSKILNNQPVPVRIKGGDTGAVLNNRRLNSDWTILNSSIDDSAQRSGEYQQEANHREEAKRMEERDTQAYEKEVYDIIKDTETMFLTNVEVVECESDCSLSPRSLQMSSEGSTRDDISTYNVRWLENIIASLEFDIELPPLLNMLDASTDPLTMTSLLEHWSIDQLLLDLSDNGQNSNMLLSANGATPNSVDRMRGPSVSGVVDVKYRTPFNINVTHIVKSITADCNFALEKGNSELQGVGVSNFTLVNKNNIANNSFSAILPNVALYMDPEEMSYLIETFREVLIFQRSIDVQAILISANITVVFNTILGDIPISNVSMNYRHPFKLSDYWTGSIFDLVKVAVQEFNVIRGDANYIDLEITTKITLNTMIGIKMNNLEWDIYLPLQTTADIDPMGSYSYINGKNSIESNGKEYSSKIITPNTFYTQPVVIYYNNSSQVKEVFNTTANAVHTGYFLLDELLVPPSGEIAPSNVDTTNSGNNLITFDAAADASSSNSPAALITPNNGTGSTTTSVTTNIPSAPTDMTANYSESYGKWRLLLSPPYSNEALAHKGATEILSRYSSNMPNIVLIRSRKANSTNNRMVDRIAEDLSAYLIIDSSPSASLIRSSKLSIQGIPIFGTMTVSNQLTFYNPFTVLIKIKKIDINVYRANSFIGSTVVNWSNNPLLLHPKQQTVTPLIKVNTNINSASLLTLLESITTGTSVVKSVGTVDVIIDNYPITLDLNTNVKFAI